MTYDTVGCCFITVNPVKRGNKKGKKMLTLEISRAIKIPPLAAPPPCYNKRKALFPRFRLYISLLAKRPYSFVSTFY